MTVRVVNGPPCSGKSTHIEQHAGPDDVVIDLDRIAHAIGYPAGHVDWAESTPHPARVAAMIARASLVKATLEGRVKGDVWIVDTQPSASAHERYARAGVVLLAIDPGVDECHRRATEAGRSDATHEQIDRWYGDLGVTSSDW